MAHQHTNLGSKEQAEVRRRKALELRIGGNSFRAIGTNLGVSHVRAQQLVAEALHAQAPTPEQVQTLRQIEDERLDVLQRRLLPLIDRADPDLSASARWLHLAARRAALWGLDAPTKIAATDPDGKEGGTFLALLLAAQAPGDGA